MSHSSLRRLALVAFVLCPLSAFAAVITVDSGTDDGTGCTLREAIQAANTDSAVGGCPAGDDLNDEIRFSVPTVTLAVDGVQIDEALVVTGPVTINGAPVGGIVTTTGTEVIEFRDVTFAGGRGEGGAILAFGGQIRVLGGAFDQNAAPTIGGAILVGFNASLFVDGTTFTGNRARGDGSSRGGGAIYSGGGALLIQNATFTDNRALGLNGSGGAIRVENAPSATILNATFTGNRAQSGGGAIEIVGGPMTIEGGLFTGNTASSSASGNGGAVRVGLGADVTIRDAVATGNRANEGGAFWLTGGGSLTLLGVTVEHNIAEGAAADQGGGGVFSEGVLVIGTGTTNSSFTGNRAVGAAGSGGALFVNNVSATITEGTTFAENRAQRAGGAIEVNRRLNGVPVTVSLSGCDFSRNITGRAPGNGGAIHVTNAATVTIDATRFFGNEAWNEGGAVWTQAPASLTISDSHFIANDTRNTEATNGGGALFVKSGMATVATSTFEGNRTFAAGSLGGAVLAVGGTTSLSQSTLFGNVANEAGGGIAVLSGATVIVQNATLYANRARLGGGGYSASGTLTFDSATLAGNTAAFGGGGLYNQNSPNQGTPFVTLTNTIVADNGATTGTDLKGRYASGGWNVIGSMPDAITFPAAASDQVGTDPLLGPYADNGGPTFSIALLSGSPAIDTGRTDLTVDQRGVARTEPDDVGAVEFGSAGVALVLTGVVDGPLPGGLPKAIELYVLDDIDDLSAYGVESANNGGGAAGPEFTFPAVAVTAGTYLTVASEATGFTSFFGVAPSFTSGVAAINGDDAVLLYRDGAVVDVFGDPDVDGTGQTWDYQDGWAYRDSGSGPDGPTFVDANWLRGAGIWVGTETTNASAETPWPIGTYAPAGTASVAAAAQAATVTLDRLAVVPNPFGSRAQATFAVSEAQGVTVTLYDVMGRRVQEVFSGPALAETPVRVSVDGGSLASGVYVLVLQGETVRATRQVTVAR